MTADFSNLSPVSLDPAQFHGLIGVTTQGDARLFAPSAFGTVSSVGLSVPTGLTVSGSPVTTSGTIALAFAPGYGIPTTVRQSEWDTAFGWGNHAVAGYLLSSTAATTYQPLDGDLTAIGALAGTTGLLRKTAANTWSLDTATYLQSSDIGSAILAYDANLQAFVNTFTLPTTDGTAGQVLVTNGAGVLSFATPRGFDFVQNAIPTATAVNQTWCRPGEGIYFWNGVYWLSTELLEKEFMPQLMIVRLGYTMFSGNANYIHDAFIPANSYLVDGVLNFSYYAASSSSYLTLSGGLASNFGTNYVSFSGIETRNYPGPTISSEVVIPINTRIIANLSTSTRLTFVATKTGTGSADVGPSFVVRYRRIAT